MATRLFWHALLSHLPGDDVMQTDLNRSLPTIDLVTRLGKTKVIYNIKRKTILKSMITKRNSRVGPSPTFSADTKVDMVDMS